MAADVHGVLVFAVGSVVGAQTMSEVVRVVMRIASGELVRHWHLDVVWRHLQGSASSRSNRNLLVGRRQRAARAFLRGLPNRTSVSFDGVFDQQLSVIDALLVGAGDLNEPFLSAWINWNSRKATLNGSQKA